MNPQSEFLMLDSTTLETVWKNPLKGAGNHFATGALRSQIGDQPVFFGSHQYTAHVSKNPQSSAFVSDESLSSRSQSVTMVTSSLSKRSLVRVFGLTACQAVDTELFLCLRLMVLFMPRATVNSSELIRPQERSSGRMVRGLA
jgi:hypothetical protein